MKKNFTPFMFGVALSTLSLLSVSCGGEEKKDEPKQDTTAVVKDTAPVLPTSYLGYEVMETEFPATVYIMHKESIEQTKISDFLGKHYGGIAKNEKKGNYTIDTAKAPVAIYWSWDMDSTKMPLMTEMAAARVVTVNGDVKVKDYEKLEIPASKALVIDYYGGYEGSADAHGAMDMYMKDRQLSHDFVLEEYITDPGMEKDTSKWHTRIYYILK